MTRETVDFIHVLLGIFYFYYFLFSHYPNDIELSCLFYSQHLLYYFLFIFSNIQPFLWYTTAQFFFNTLHCRVTHKIRVCLDVFYILFPFYLKRPIVYYGHCYSFVSCSIVKLLSFKLVKRNLKSLASSKPQQVCHHKWGFLKWVRFSFVSFLVSVFTCFDCYFIWYLLYIPSCIHMYSHIHIPSYFVYPHPFVLSGAYLRFIWYSSPIVYSNSNSPQMAVYGYVICSFFGSMYLTFCSRSFGTCLSFTWARVQWEKNLDW